ncbi:16S rRNA processing protein RimM [Sphingobacteriales bacterium UPWRP_1]|nr:16S rRNA processing protein RimM [Sphingobacteriales bacterium TSM_CSM]PSJ75692.1 16S rRNA processing protein RimM [Sphingobacteriales bacterium UPWRP_1]
MKPEDLIPVGYIGQPKSFKGDVKAYFEAFLFDHLQELKDKLPYLLVQTKEGCLPYFVEHIQPVSGNNGLVIIKFEDINSREEALALQNKALFMETNKLPDDFLPEQEEFEWEFIIGFTLTNAATGQTIGMVEDVFALPEHELAQVYYQNCEILIPLHEDLVEAIDEEQKTISLHLPEGLLEVYLQTNAAEEKDTD